VAGLQTATAGEVYVATAATDGATATPHRDAVQGSGSAPLDETQQRLLLTRNVTAIVAGALIVLWFLGLVTRPFRRRNRPGGGPATTVVVPAGPYGQQPGPYGQQPGPYGQQPGPYGQQPGQQWQPQPPPGYPPAGGYPPAPAVPAGGPPQPTVPAPAAGPPQGTFGPSYTPPPPSGYAGPAQPYSGATTPVQQVPRTTSARSGGCLGCLGWLVFVVDVLVLGASAAALYLWTTPLLTFPG
jgi:hypothetical protein